MKTKQIIACLKRGDRTAVALPIGDYEKLLEELDDLASLRSAATSPLFRTTNSPPN